MSASVSGRSGASDAGFLYVKLAERGGETPAKKLLKPSTVAQLLKQCNQLFKPAKPILSFKTDTGEQVKSLKDLPSGATLIASTRPAKKKDENTNSTISFKDVESMGFIGGSPTMSGGVSTVSFSQQGSPMVGRSPSQMSGRFSQQRSVSFAPPGAAPATGLRAGSISPTKSVASSKMDSSVFDESQMGRSQMSRMRPAAAPPTPIKAAMITMMAEDKILAPLDYLVSKASNKEFILNLAPLEETQARAWYTAVTDQPVLAHLVKNINVYEEVRKYAETFVEDHRFLCANWVDHRVKLAVVGPRKSGKSIMLGELANQLLVEMVYTGEWKSTLVFSLDVLQIIPLLDDYPALLSFFVDTTVDAMVAQRPYLHCVTKGLKKKLKSITEMRAYEPPLSEVSEYDEIALRLSGLWRSSDSAVPFFTTIFMLPILLAKVSGFENVLMVVDNIDCGDIEVVPHEPFDPEQESLFIIEFIKFALDHCNFIMACMESDRFFQVMGPSDETGVNLMEGTNIASTLDVAEIDEEDMATRYVISIEGETMGLPMNALMCGGVVHYLRLWDRFRRYAEDLEQYPERYDALIFNVINSAQELVDLLYQQDTDDEELRVSGISRVPESRS